MTWATRTTLTMEAERELPPDLLECVRVRALAEFGIGEKLVQVGDVVTVARHRADYLRFLQMVEWL